MQRLNQSFRLLQVAADAACQPLLVVVKAAILLTLVLKYRCQKMLLMNA